MADFDEILYTAADFELDERHVIKMKKLHWTDSEFDRTYFLFSRCQSLMNFCRFKFYSLPQKAYPSAKYRILMSPWPNFQWMRGSTCANNTKEKRS